MIQARSKLEVFDNSGAKKVRCIRSYRNKKQKIHIGDIILTSVIRIRTKLKKPVKKGEMYKGILLTKKQPFLRNDGSILKFNKNITVLLKNKDKLLGTRIFGIAPKELRIYYPKFVNLVKFAV